MDGSIFLVSGVDGHFFRRVSVGKCIFLLSRGGWGWSLVLA